MNSTLAIIRSTSPALGRDENGNRIYLNRNSTSGAKGIAIPMSVPSGYARQAQREAALANGFTAFKNGLVK